MVSATPKSPRERAARALCQFHGHPPDIRMDGRPMWMSYLEEVDVALRADLDERAWQTIRNAGPPES